jgi:hypothetical protein
MKTWLVTWEWTGDAEAVADRVAAVLNSRWGEQRVIDIVETLYALATSTPDELADYARRPSDNPYRAKRSFDGKMSCGHHPWLEARIVTEFEVKIDSATGLERFSWMEPDTYAAGPDGPIKTTAGTRREFSAESMDLLAAT